MKRVFCVFFCVCFLLMKIQLPAYAKERKQIVRVAIPLAEGFLEQAENGTYVGYMHTYLQKISQYTAWDYEIITNQEGQSSKELFQMLDHGEVDLLMGAEVNDTNKQVYAFPEKHIGNSYVTLAVSAQDILHVPNDYRAYEGMVIGYMQDDERSYQALHTFANSYHFSFEEVAYTSYEALREDVKKQAIDAMVGVDIVVDQDLRINNRFSSTQIGIAMRKEYTTLYDDLNFALDSIHEVNIHSDTQLYDTFFPKTYAPQFLLSEEEKAYLQEITPLRVVSGMNTVPLDYFEDGVLKGVSAEMLDRIHELTGIEFTYAHASNLEEAYKRIADHEADIITSLYDDRLGSTHEDITFLSPLESLQMVIIKNRKAEQKQLSDLRMALPAGYDRIDDMLAKEVQTFDSMEECILAVHQGRADFVHGSAYALEYYIRKHGISNVSLIPLSNASRSLMLGASKEMDPRLLSILNKAIHCISEEERQQIYFHAMFVADNEVTITAFIRMHFVKVLAVVIITMTLLCIVILHVHKKRRQEEMAQVRRYQMLADISGDFIFEYDFVKDQLMISASDAERLGVPSVIDNYIKSVKNQEFFFSIEDMDMLSEEELHDPRLHSFQRDLAWTSMDGLPYTLHAFLMVERDDKNHPILCIGRLIKEAV